MKIRELYIRLFSKYKYPIEYADCVFDETQWHDKLIIMSIEIMANERNNNKETIVVYANPIEEMILDGKIISQTYNEHQGNDTLCFLFQNNDSLYEVLDRIGHGRGAWTPSKQDYIEKNIQIEGVSRLVFIHNSLRGLSYDPTLNSGNIINLIPDRNYKLKTLRQRYYVGGWSMYTPSYYISTMPEGNPDFFCWLFGDDSLKNKKLDELDKSHIEEFRRFCDKFSEITE